MKTALQLAIRTILEKSTSFEWSIQGFGMLRLHLRDDARIHIWDKSLRYPNVSMIHNHSWDLRSEIVVGELRNARFVESNCGPHFIRRRLVTGYKTKMVSAEESIRLQIVNGVEHYIAGETYSQLAHEIHSTDAEDSTVALMHRNEHQGDGTADVFWPADKKWGTAKPRIATDAEVEVITDRVLKKHFAHD